jgi:hypothetical protein
VPLVVGTAGKDLLFRTGLEVTTNVITGDHGLQWTRDCLALSNGFGNVI